MRIAVNTLSVIPDLVGGGETYLANLTREMAGLLETRETMVLICTRQNAGLFPRSSGGVSRIVLPLSQRRRSLRLIMEHLALPLLVPVLGADVLLSPGNAVPLFAGVRHVLALQSMHYLFVGHQMSPARVRYFRRMVPLSAGRAARVICMSEDLRRALLRVSPRSRRKAVVVYEGADLLSFTPHSGAASGGDYLLFVSSLNPFKRPDSVIRALAALRVEGFEPPPLRMVGRPDPEHLARVREVIRREGVEDLVSVEGVVPYAELPDLYRGASCLVYPSALETFGLPPLEAMACGCPVVASNRSSVPEVVGDAALTVDPDDIPALAGAIRRVLTDRELRASLRLKGFENVTRFSWRRAAEETLGAIRAARGLPKCLDRPRRMGRSSVSL